MQGNNGKLTSIHCKVSSKKTWHVWQYQDTQVFAPAWSRQLHPAKNTVLLGAVNQGLQGEGLGISVELQDLATCRARKAQCNNSSIGGIPVNLRVILLGMHHVVDESLYRY